MEEEKRNYRLGSIGGNDTHMKQRRGKDTGIRMVRGENGSHSVE